MYGLPGISPEVRGHDIKNLLLITRFTSGGMWQTQHLVFTRVTRGGQDVCHVMTSCFQDCLIKSLVAFSTGESLNEGLCSLPGLILCQSLWLWSASEPNPSLEGWLAAVGDSSKFLSRLYKTDFISFRLLLHWCFTKFSQWIFSVLALSPCGFYIHFQYQ